MHFEIPNLLNSKQLQDILQLLQQATFVDGRQTAGSGSDYQKNNLQAATDNPAVQQAQQLVRQAIDASPKFRTLAIPRRVQPVTFNCYRQGMYYHDHTDHSLLPAKPPLRGDLSMTLFLSRPEDYEGGELVINSDGPGAVSVKLPAGSAVIYDACTMHKVRVVTAGERLGAVTSIESMIADSSARDLVGEMAQLTRWVQDTAPRTEAERRANKIYANLLRRWTSS